MRTATILALLACSGCVTDDLGTEESALYTDTDHIWFLPSNISVCFESDAQGTQSDRNIVRDAIEDSWERSSGIDFSGWGLCGSSGAEVRIRFADEKPHVDSTNGLGWALINKPGAVTLNNAFQSFQYPNENCTGANRVTCMRKTSIHEFGHVLGFGHEEQRPDSRNTTCDPQNVSYSYTTGPDPLSIMSVCPVESERLSETDVKGLKSIYGAKPPASIVGLGGKCLDIPGGSTATLVTPQTFRCHGGTNQQWDWYEQDLHLKSRVVSSNDPAALRFLEAWSGNAYPYTYGYYNDSYQQWRFDAVELRSYGDLCLAQIGEGTDAYLTDCTRGDSVTLAGEGGHVPDRETWRVRQVPTSPAWFELRSKDFGGVEKCLTRPVGTGNATMTVCDTGTDLRWHRLPNGKLENALGGCLYDKKNYTRNLGIATCDSDFDSSAKWFHFSGRIANLSDGRCLEVAAGTASDSDDAELIEMHTCSLLGANERQIFDFYF